MEFNSYLQEKKKIIDGWLDDVLPEESAFPQIIHEAMRYAVFPGGKRIRPILILASFECVGGGDIEWCCPFAEAVELIHCYSLIHDDLPCMDNDDYRRGRPSCHRKFGESIALLAGDALLTFAFNILSRATSALSDEKINLLTRELSEACGSFGMIAGQVLDVETDPASIDEATLRYIHTHKTGALIRTCVRGGALIAGAGERELSLLTKYGDRIGLVFQIVDDLLDWRKKGGTSDRLSYPALFGVKRSREEVRVLTQEAVSYLHPFGPSGRVLEEMAYFISTQGGIEGFDT